MGFLYGTFVAQLSVVMTLFFQRHRIVVLHVAFWCFYFSFFFYQISLSRRGEEVNLLEAFYNTVSHVSYVALAAYLNYAIALPRFMRHKNWGRYLLEFAIPFALLTFLYVYAKRFQIDGCTHKVEFFYSQKFIVLTLVGTLFIVIFVAMFKFLEDWFELEAKRKEIENEKLNAELRFLKAQINPHFLFNTLNNLYALAFAQSPNTTEVIAKLSQMMRYMIYDSNHAKVPLRKEIEYMENYISLEQLRLNNEIPIEFKVDGNPDTVKIVPLILITFLENAFKHGVSNNAPDAWIRLHLVLTGTDILYTVENSKLAKANPEPPGIGLQNVRRRLELSYPGQYELDILDDPDAYAIRLKINHLN